MKVYGEHLFKVTKTNQFLDPKNWSWVPTHKEWLTNPQQFRIKSTFEVFGDITKKFTLVISQRDVQTGALLKALQKQKMSYLFIDWDNFSQKGAIHLSDTTSYLSYKNKKVDLSKVKSVYYSTPDLIEAQYDTSNYFSMSEKLYINRWAESLLSLESILTKTKWLPAKPSKLTSLSQKKYTELNLAKRIGLKIPNTIFTSDTHQAQHFLNKNKKVLLREFGRRVFTDKKNQFKQIENKIIETNSIHLIQNAPCVLQEYIEKQFEVRAVVIGNKVLSCKIESQKHSKSKTDWRNQEAVAPFTKIILPKTIQTKLIKLQKQLGFELSCFDLIYSNNNQYYFLEMNRPGSWFFIEALTGLKIREAVINLF